MNRVGCYKDVFKLDGYLKPSSGVPSELLRMLLY